AAARLRVPDDLVRGVADELDRAELDAARLQELRRRADRRVALLGVVLLDRVVAGPGGRASVRDRGMDGDELDRRRRLEPREARDQAFDRSLRMRRAVGGDEGFHGDPFTSVVGRTAKSS